MILYNLLTSWKFEWVFLELCFDFIRFNKYVVSQHNRFFYTIRNSVLTLSFIFRYVFIDNLTIIQVQQALQKE